MSEQWSSVKHVELMLSYDAREKFGFKSSKSFSKYIMEKLKSEKRSKNRNSVHCIEKFCILV